MTQYRNQVFKLIITNPARDVLRRWDILGIINGVESWRNPIALPRTLDMVRNRFWVVASSWAVDARCLASPSRICTILDMRKSSNRCKWTKQRLKPIILLIQPAPQVVTHLCQELKFTVHQVPNLDILITSLVVSKMLCNNKLYISSTLFPYHPASRCEIAVESYHPSRRLQQAWSQSFLEDQSQTRILYESSSFALTSRGWLHSNYGISRRAHYRRGLDAVHAVCELQWVVRYRAK